MLKKSIVVLALIIFTTSTALIAGEKGTATVASGKAEHVTLKGTLVCLGCDLKKTEGPHAACSVYGHRHALKTADGKYIAFLDNKFSEDLIKGEKYHNKKIEVDGIYYPEANVLDVETFTVDGKKKGWCNMCKQMDSCPFKKKGI
jgi:hypothetical protein